MKKIILTLLLSMTLFVGCYIEQLKNTNTSYNVEQLENGQYMFHTISMAVDEAKVIRYFSERDYKIVAMCCDHAKGITLIMEKESK